MPKRYLSHNDLLDIVSAKSGFKQETIDAILRYTTMVILSELQNVGKVNLRDIGEFSTEVKGGKDELFLQEDGTWRKKYIERKNFVNFAPNKNFINRLNGEKIIGMTKKDLDLSIAKANKDVLSKQPYSYSDHVSEFDKSGLDETGKMLMSLGKQRRNFMNYLMARERGEEYVPLNVKGATSNKVKVRILTNGNVYDTIKDACRNEGIRPNRFYWAIEHGNKFVINENGDPISFEILESTTTKVLESEQ